MNIQYIEWQIETDEAAVAEQAARKVKEAPSPTVSPNTTPAQSAITGEHPNAVKPHTHAPATTIAVPPLPAPPVVRERPNPTQRVVEPLDMCAKCSDEGQPPRIRMND